MTSRRTALTALTVACLAAASVTACGFVMPPAPEEPGDPGDTGAEHAERPGSSTPVGGELGEPVEEALGGASEPDGHGIPTEDSDAAGPLPDSMPRAEVEVRLMEVVDGFNRTLLAAHRNELPPEALLEFATPLMAQVSHQAFGTSLPDDAVLEGAFEVVGVVVSSDWDGGDIVASVCTDDNGLTVHSPSDPSYSFAPNLPFTRSTLVFTPSPERDRFLVQERLAFFPDAEDPCLV